MRTSFILLACAAGLLAMGAAQAQTTQAPSAAQAAQQERMRVCNAEAGKRNLSGNNRRSFMSQCLSGRMPDAPAAAAPATQQDRMRACNTIAGQRNLSGDARRTFMSTCLGGN